MNKSVNKILVVVFVCISFFGYIALNIKAYNGVNDRNSDLIALKFETRFSLFGTNYGFSNDGGGIDHYHFGGGRVQIFDQTIFRPARFWHKVIFNLYRESHSLPCWLAHNQ